MSDLSLHLARAATGERLRSAGERRRAIALAEALGDADDPSGRQRRLVRLSLLLAKRSDPVAEGRRG